MRKKIIILGSTGSIGTQTLDVVRAFPDSFEVIGLSAHSNSELFSRQVAEFKPKYAVETSKYKDVVAALEELATCDEADCVINAVCSSVGVWPTLAAVKKGKTVALANKESLVMAGELIMKTAQKTGAKILPIDSEPSGIWSLFEGREDYKDSIEKLIITASGGPFLGKTRVQLEKVTPEEALKHPTWKMGKKISIDSATLMNKAFEIIETRWMFDVKPERIDVTVHPQSIVHAMIQWRDGSLQAALSNPDMRIAIQRALHFPHTAPNSLPRVDLSSLELTFRMPDYGLFKGPSLAYEVLKQGGIMPAALCLLDEIAVSKFMSGKISFLEITSFIEDGLKNIVNEPLTEVSLKNIISSLPNS